MIKVCPSVRLSSRSCTPCLDNKHKYIERLLKLTETQFFLLKEIFEDVYLPINFSYIYPLSLDIKHIPQEYFYIHSKISTKLKNRLKLTEISIN